MSEKVCIQLFLCADLISFKKDCNPQCSAFLLTRLLSWKSKCDIVRISETSNREAENISFLTGGYLI